MSQEIPLIAQVAQSIKIVLDEQACEIQIRERLGNLYMSMVVDGVESWNNYVCYNQQNIKPFTYMPFRGGLYFVDIEGDTDPVSSGLNTRYFLVFFSEGESIPSDFVNNTP
jgi:hypothetical protein